MQRNILQRVNLTVVGIDIFDFQHIFTKSALTKIGGNYLLVFLYLARGTLGKFFPKIEHHDRIADIHDQFHVMLHQDNSNPGVADSLDQMSEIGSLTGVESGGRFIQQNYFRLEGHGTGYFQKTTFAEGQIFSRLGGMVGNA